METNVSALVKTQENYLDYGEYVNSTRCLPSIYDGLKSVQRRIFWSMHHMKKDFIKSQTVNGDVIGKYHPHSDVSVYGALCTLVNRTSLLIPQGAWGVSLLEELPAAAARYTEVCFTKENDLKLFELEKYFHIVDSDIQGFQEPEYLIIKNPIALIAGGGGIGIGVATTIPSFHEESLDEAYEKDNYECLKINSRGLDIVEADYQNLWKTGRGSIVYRYNVKKEWSALDNSEVVVIEGEGSIFKPRLEAGFRSWREEGLCWERDESRDKIRVVIGKTKHVKRLNIDQLFERAKLVSTKKFTYNIVVFDPRIKHTKPIGVREWLHTTRNLYAKTFDKYITDNINWRLKEIELFRLVPQVLQLIMNNTNESTIMKTLNLSREEVRKIENFPLKYRRNEVIEDRIKDMQNQINSFKIRRLPS